MAATKKPTTKLTSKVKGRRSTKTHKSTASVGGGTAHGAKNEFVKLKMTKKMRRKALLLALTLKAKSKNVHLVSDANFSTETKTAPIQKQLLSFYPVNKKTVKVLVVFPHDASGRKAAENIEYVTAIEPCNLNAYIIMNNDELVV